MKNATLLCSTMTSLVQAVLTTQLSARKQPVLLVCRKNLNVPRIFYEPQRWRRKHYDSYSLWERKNGTLSSFFFAACNVDHNFPSMPY